MASDKKLEELDLSKDELDRLSAAFKNEEFRKLFADYAEEISDPENRKRYEQELQQMEAERGMDVQFVHPQPGYVIKTSVDGTTKGFINICKNDLIEKPSLSKGVNDKGMSGMSWSIPHSLAPPREDTDKKKGKCKVFDVVFHPDTYRMAETNARFKKMINDTAMDAIERQFDIKFDRNNLKFPKLTFKGVPQPTVVRKKKEEEPVKQPDPDDIMKNFPYPYDGQTTEEKMKKREAEIKEREKTKKEQDAKTKTSNDNNGSGDSGPAVPKYVITHRSEIDFQDFRNAPDAKKTNTRPNWLVVSVQLPLLNSAKSVDLDIFEKKLKLESTKPAAYKLDINLPYEVDENKGSAKFDKSERQLIITLPVIPGKEIKQPSFFDKEKTQKSENMNGDSEEVGIPDDLPELEPFEDDEVPRKPLIEVISEGDHEHRNSVQAEKTKEPAGKKSDIFDDEIDKTIQPPSINYLFPDFTAFQGDETVTFILNVKNVSRENVSKTFSSDQSSVTLKFVSIGSGGFAMHFAFYVEFPQGYKFEVASSSVDVSSENAVLVIIKTDECLGIWEEYKVGLNKENTEERLFVTNQSIARELDELEADQDKATNKMPALEVTEMNEKKLSITIKSVSETEAAKDDSSTGSEIEVVHNKEVPKLHGILKQRSRTLSESSEEALSSSYGRENSISSSINGSESPISEGEEEQWEGGRKKSVSFSESIDRTTYKINQSVSSMQSTLKSKRRRAKKKEQKQESKETRRRRRNSGSISEPSSDEHGSHGHGQEQDVGSGDFSGSHDEHEGESSGISSEGDQQNKALDDISHVQMASSKKNKNKGKNKKGKKNKKEALERTNSDESSSKNESDDPRTNSDTEIVSKDGSGEKEFEDELPGSPTIKAKHQVNFEVDENDSDDCEEKPKIEEIPCDNKEKGPETMLNWNDGNSAKEQLSEFKTQCAFSFSNTMMYDLDDE